ncbi:hypothetical protein TNCV_921261 [Trichonephila clavipes]|nr:hypothetical protein TNCV_921261 [Trichonephila clavipes]
MAPPGDLNSLQKCGNENKVNRVWYPIDTDLRSRVNEFPPLYTKGLLQWPKGTTGHPRFRDHDHGLFLCQGTMLISKQSKRLFEMRGYATNIKEVLLAPSD